MRWTPKKGDHFNVSKTQKLFHQHFPQNTFEDTKVDLSVCMIVKNEEKHLLRKADIALKSARKKGRGYAIVYDESYSDIKKYKEVFL